ncbi:MAG TPA: hypothetical protein VMT59_10350 [Gaiellaceae bacterium]|nr:hypothetical protein [Gaiellaceae bacterium]
MSDQPQPMSTPIPAQPPLVARDPDEVLPPRRRRALRPLTAVLAAVVLVGAGFLGGIQVQKHYGGSSGGSSGAAAAFASRFRSAGGAAGAAGSFFGGGAGAGASGASGGTQEIGQVSVIKGSTLYLADFLGNTIKVQIPAGVRVSETTRTTVRGIHPGDTVTASVTKLPNGSYRATSVTVTPSGT